MLLQVSALQTELDASRGGVRDQLAEKDVKINALVEELGNSQAMLNDKISELAQVTEGWRLKAASLGTLSRCRAGHAALQNC